MKFTSDQYIRAPGTLTLDNEATCAFRSGPPEYRRKLGEQCTTMNDDRSIVVQFEALVCAVCVIVVTFTWLFVLVVFIGERRDSHCWGCPRTVECFTDL